MLHRKRQMLGGSKGPVKVIVNGKTVAGNISRVELKTHEEIAVIAGRTPQRVPSRYAFPAGE